MFKIDINEEIEDYKSGAFKGLTLKEVCFAGLTLIVGSTVTMVSHKIIGVPIELAIYLAIPLSLPCALTGFYNRNGMNFPEMIRAVIEVKIKGPFLYQSEEYLPVQTQKKSKWKRKKEEKEWECSQKHSNILPEKS